MPSPMAVTPMRDSSGEMKSVLAARTNLAFWGVAILAVLASAPRVHAETLADVLSEAYRSNPTLLSQRAQLRAVDESYAAALSELGPTVQVQVTANYQQTRLGKATRNTERLSTALLPDFLEQNSGQGEIVVTQPLYTGGHASADLDVAAAKVRAAREALKATEANIMLSVIQAYSSVVEDGHALEIRRLNLETLEHQVVETKARLNAGEVTQTDVSQAEAQLASENALYAQAQGQMGIDRAAFFAVVGRNPGSLDDPPDLQGLPDTIDEAFSLAETESPDLKAAYFTEQESRAQIRATRSTYAGTVSASVQYGSTGSLTPFDPRNLQRAAVGIVTYSQPLYTSGLDRAQIRQSLEANASDRFNIETARRSVVQNVANGWTQLATATRTIAAQEAQIKAAEISFKGMRLEYRAGDRSTLDVLVAEETLRDAELALAAARRDRLVAEATLLRYMGRLSPEALVGTLRPYQPSDHFTRSVHTVPPWTASLFHLDRVGQHQDIVVKPEGSNPTRKKSEDGPSSVTGLTLPERPIEGPR